MTLTVLNSLPLGVLRGREVLLRLQRLTYSEALELIAGADKVESYVRHPATAELLRVPVSDALLGAILPGDTLLIATLRLTSRPPREHTPTPDDLVLWLVRVLPAREDAKEKEVNPAEKEGRANGPAH